MHQAAVRREPLAVLDQRGLTAFPLLPNAEAASPVRSVRRMREF
jgi:hypothetical protein